MISELINVLQIFLQIHIFMDTTEIMEFKLTLVLRSIRNYYNAYLLWTVLYFRILCVSYTFPEIEISYKCI